MIIRRAVALSGGWKRAAGNALIILEWYKAMGADEAIAETPLDWFAPEPQANLRSAPAGSAPSLDIVSTKSPGAGRSLPQRPQTAPAAIQKAPAASGDAMAARELARSAATLEDLRALLETFEGCALKKTASRLCMARGSSAARIMLIGEAPGKDEDAKGIPFVGRAGQLLDRMLAAIGLTGDDVYVTNLVFWRPPGNRTPSPEEVQVCQPFVERQIELLAPDILVFLGNAAARQLTGATEGIMKLRGKWLTYEQPGSTPIRAIATLHPAYLLRNPIAKRLAWRDLILIREALNANLNAASA